jgi:TPR repeat protein
MCNLGVMYADGRGVAQDYGEALRLYQLAAKKGDALAARNLGTMYENEQGVTRDDKEAARYYRLAAERGDSAASAMLDRLVKRT